MPIHRAALLAGHRAGHRAALLAGHRAALLAALLAVAVMSCAPASERRPAPPVGAGAATLPAQASATSSATLTRKSGSREIELRCRHGEHLKDAPDPGLVPPTRLRWLGMLDDERLARVLHRVCWLLLKEGRAPTEPEPSFQALFRAGTARAETARCLTSRMLFSRPLSHTFGRPFIPPFDGEGPCGEDEMRVLGLRAAADVFFARAFEVRSGEADACTNEPTLPAVLHERAFLALANGDYQRASQLYGRAESICPSSGYAAISQLRQADVAYEQALAGMRSWEGLDTLYDRIESTCAAQEGVGKDRVPNSCGRVLYYMRMKRPIVSLVLQRRDEANEAFRGLIEEGRRRPCWLSQGWWCSHLDSDVLRWGLPEAPPCQPEATPRFGGTQCRYP